MVRCRHVQCGPASSIPTPIAVGGHAKPKESSRRAEKEQKAECGADPTAGAALDDDAAWGPAGSAAVALSAAAEKAKESDRGDARAAKGGDRMAAAEARRAGASGKGSSSRRSVTRDARLMPPSVPPKRPGGSTRLAAVAEAEEAEERERAERRVSIAPCQGGLTDYVLLVVHPNGLLATEGTLQCSHTRRSHACVP
jgi:hypothetical protein